MSSRGKSSGGDSAKTATKRPIKELDVWRKEQRDAQGIERLGPVSEDNLLEWEAVINGRGIGCGYDGTFTLLPLYFTPAAPTRPPVPVFLEPKPYPAS